MPTGGGLPPGEVVAGAGITTLAGKKLFIVDANAVGLVLANCVRIATWLGSPEYLAYCAMAACICAAVAMVVIEYLTLGLE